MYDLERIHEADPNRAWYVEPFHYRTYTDVDSRMQLTGEEIDCNPTVEALRNLIQARRDLDQFIEEHRDDAT